MLKPVDEPRMFERIGQSLAANGYEVFIIGADPSSAGTVREVAFISFQRFKRMSIQRIIARFTILRKVISIKPDILIVCTHELLGVALFYRIFTGGKIIYDVQENYWRNILYTNAFPAVIRPLIATLVRVKERIASPFIVQFILAEKSYRNEMKFMGKKSTILENKCKIPEGFRRNPAIDVIQLIFTGTLAESTGIFKAISLAKKLHALEPKVRLTIIGHSALSEVLELIENQILQHNFIRLIGGNKFVPHEAIFDAIATANFGLVCYPSSPHTVDKIPSKLYEYLACHLPILLQNHPAWLAICAPCNAGIAIDFENPDVISILQSIQSRNFYSSPPDSVSWKSEETRLLGLLSSL